MKVLLINPPYNIENYYGKLSKMGFIFPPVGLTYLAGFVREKGHEVRIYDFQVTEQNFSDFLKKFGPDFVGITCQTALFYNTLKLAKKIKKEFPQEALIFFHPPDLWLKQFLHLPRNHIRHSPPLNQTPVILPFPLIALSIPAPPE